MSNYTRFMDALIANARRPAGAPAKPLPPPGDPVTQNTAPIYERAGWNFERNEAHNALLLAALALRAFKLERGSYPASLKELAPAFLQRAPRDPFRPAASLVYKPRGASYLLYSVGPDGRDDNGKPIFNAKDTGRRRYLVQPDSRGDIVAGINSS